MTADIATLARLFAVRRVDPAFALPDIELFPKRRGIVIRDYAGERRMDLMTWGVPSPKAGGAPVTNIRNLSSGFWRTDLATPALRCLVPVSDFAEWEGEKGRKIARWFSIINRELFAFAGLWRQIGGAAYYAFLTCEPNPLVAAVHPKAMPVVLHETDYFRWLTRSAADVSDLASPFPSQLMAMV